ncbi:hypothetical protein [Natronomonas gomsonensis]|uniref:hypothetical protein n=1 Tax=Natronomonas gomsonensis TaxID=1046043 RepID=UPI0015BA0BE9|nr:hypothetical protein [Natronomonas gomsonensis]
MKRRALLAAVGSSTVALSGCLVGVDPLNYGDSETPEPCTVDRTDPVEPSSEMEPRELPERPEELNDETVESYLRAYESAYRQHLILSEDTTAYGHSESFESVREVEGGYRVEMRTNFYYEEDTDRGKVHADSPYFRVRYLITDDRLLRAVGEGHDAEPTLEDAETMECW